MGAASPVTHVRQPGDARQHAVTSGRLARNTVALFARQLLIVAINLYTIRVILAGLGIDDFALFNVIVNVVAIGSFLPGALGMITQRNVAFAIGEGRGDRAALKRVHDASLLLCVAVSVLAVVALETVGGWFVAYHLVVPSGKLDAAQMLFQLSIVTFVAGNFSGFYASLIMANEDMHVFAIFSVIDAFLRLGAALAIDLFSSEHLVAYGWMLAGISLGVMGAYWLFCSRRYPECRLARFAIEIATLREMLGFAGWTLFGQISTISRNQAVTILINQAFNPSVVAARAIAVSVSTQALVFCTNFSAALHPPIIKAHAAGEREQMFSLVFMGSRMAFFLMWLITLPLLAVMPWILGAWLGDYPEETILLTRLALIENAITAVSLTLMTAVRATGQMRLYELSLGLLQAMVLLLSWLLVRSGYPAYSVYLVAIAINLAMFAVRLAIASNKTGLPIGAFLRQVGLPVLLVGGASSGLVLAVLGVAPGIQDLEFSVSSLAGAALICLLPVGIVYALGLSGEERRLIHAMVRRRQAFPGAVR